jgi:hypothetical protein
MKPDKLKNRYNVYIFIINPKSNLNHYTWLFEISIIFWSIFYNLI